MEKIIGYCSVDSGQILLIDPCYVWDDPFDMHGEPTGGAYDAACRITLGEQGGGQHPQLGVVASTLHGDGSYPVTATFVNGRIASLTIDFDHDGDPEDEGCWECGESEWDCECGLSGDEDDED